MRIAAELRDHEAAGSLAEELPYWGWLEDGRTCLTRTGELIAAGRLAPAVVDGRSPEQIDRVLGRWQRLLSGLDSDTRLYFYMLRRPSPPEATDDEGSGIVAVSQRKRRAFLAGRVQQLEAYLVWSHDPRLRAVADGPASGRASRLTQWWKRRRGGAPTYLRSEIEAAAARFRATVDAGRALVEEHTPIEMLEPGEASRLLSELINRPGTVWHGATGSGMNWRLALSELEAERGHLRLDGEPVILYSLLSPPGQTRANLLRELYCLDAVMTVSLEWRPWAMEAARRRIRGAQRHYFAKRYSMMAHVQETEGTAAAMVDSAAATESDRLGEALVELEADGVSYGEPGHDTSTALRSWGAAHRGLWLALENQGRSVEVVAVARTSREMDRALAVMSGWAEASGPGEPDAGIREEIDRIERAILQGAVQILEEFGGLQGALKRSVALEKQAHRQAGRGAIHHGVAWQTVRLAGARYR